MELNLKYFIILQPAITFLNGITVHHCSELIDSFVQLTFAAAGGVSWRFGSGAYLFI
jgi:hypothetical protein